MKKAGVVILTLMLFLQFFSMALAQDELTSEGELAQTTESLGYQCLEERVKGQCSTLTFEEQVFSLLALAYNSEIAQECSGTLDTSRDCWPAGSCNLKDTALTTLAISRIGADTSKQEAWMTSKVKSADKLIWYLEIDTPGNATCKLGYDGASYNLKIKADKTLDLQRNNCLKISDDYWVEIDSDCLSKAYEVTCTDSDFISTLVYKTSASETLFVTGTIESSSAGGKTSHQISSLCFVDGDKCDYQGSLWATYTLLKLHKDVKPYLPYLFAFASENEKFVPYSFLYALTAEDEYRNKLMEEQRTEGYWDWNSGKGKFYDTALTLIAFQNEGQFFEVIDNVKSYLDERQNSDGCWQNSVRDTAFLLWALWPKETTIQVAQPDCATSAYYCITEGECSAAGGNLLDNYKCLGLKACCDEQPALKTCSELNGLECPSGLYCSSAHVAASDTEDCCLGQCLPEEQQTECEQYGYICKPFCDEQFEDEVIEYECDLGDVCCKPKIAEEEGGILIWIVIFVFLIGLTTVGIIYRQKLKELFMKLKDKFSKKPSGTPAAGPGPVGPRPPYPPGYPGRPGMPQRPMPIRR